MGTILLLTLQMRKARFSKLHHGGRRGKDRSCDLKACAFRRLALCLWLEKDSGSILTH